MNCKKYLKRVLNYIINGVPVNIIEPKIVSLSKNSLLEGRTALITGGSSGIGLGIANAFLKSGASVILTGRNATKLKKVKDTLCECYSSDKIITIVWDMRAVGDFNSLFHDLLTRINGGKIDILVNNAGVLGCQLANADEKSFDAALETNIKGPFFLSKIVGEYMKNNHIHGNILNIASSSSFRPAACSYTISKWGMRGFTLGLAKALIPYDIVVNGLAPGPTVTPMVKADGDNNYYIEKNPAHRYATIEEIANMATILVSDMGRMIIGDIVCMTGGAGIITFDDINYKF